MLMRLDNQPARRPAPKTFRTFRILLAIQAILLAGLFLFHTPEFKVLCGLGVIAVFCLALWLVLLELRRRLEAIEHFCTHHTFPIVGLKASNDRERRS